MKHSFWTKLFMSVSTAILISAVSANADFTQIKEYAADTFKDVAENSWYYNDVKTAYTLGLVNGKGNALFSPDDSITVAEGITLASRIHEISFGKEIGNSSGENWYDVYVSYAVSNGIIENDTFENYDRNLLRHEMAELISKAMLSENYAPINEVQFIPDVANEEEYFDDLLKLYNAGIVMGSTVYGDFLPTSPITRCETAAIISRAVLPEKRLKKELEPYGRRGEAVYLINDISNMIRTVRNVSRIASGWKYENTIDMTIDDKNTSSNVLVDKSDTGYTAMHRDITTVSDGTVELQVSYTPVKPGYKMVLSDISGNNIFTFESKTDGSYVAVGDSKQKINYSFTNETINAHFVFDLDKRKAKIVKDGKDIGTFDMSESATDISRLSFVTGKDEQTTVTVNNVIMYTNFVINDMFRTIPVGSTPYGWKTSGDAAVRTQLSDTDTNSVGLNGTAVASKSFDRVSGKFVYETFVKVPDGKDIDVALKSGETTVLSVTAKDGKFTCGGQLVRNFDSTVWQLIRIEADTLGKTAKIKINNKECLTVPFGADFIDSVEISSDGNGYAWFDDVKLFNVYDYPDYCPEPVPVTDDGTYLGMSVCSLWREGTHYGWDYVSPYDELTPLMGYYDEGIPEVADWEIKFLVEHGYDFQHFCWYAGTTTDGMKGARMCYALHDGYMNAKYSHMQDFMLMWENAGYSTGGFEKFKKDIWNYWCEWYFSDDRYFTINNKPVLTIYQYGNFIKAMRSNDAAKDAITFMKEDIKKLGYDGMIILFCNRGTNASDNALFKELGADAMMSYNFGEMSYDANHQKGCMDAAFSAGNLSLVPCIGVGFNDIGWTETRSPNATPEAHKEVMLWARDNYMPRLDEREDEDWISNLVIANTWNEYGEGHYIMPSHLNGFGYLDAAREVFSAATGTDDSTHYDIAPTLNQKKRLGYLYPNRTQPIKRTYWIANGINYDKLPIVKGWNFENATDSAAWLPLMQLSSLNYDSNEKALVGVSNGNDPAINTIKTSANYIDADSVKYMKIRMKYEEDITSSASIFFITEGDSNYSADRGLHFNVISSDDQYKDYYVDLSANKYWRGTVTQVRIDPSALPGKFYIKSIEFLGEDEKDLFILNVDGKEVKITSDFAKKTDDEVFVAGDPTLGFYSINNFYTEWDRHSGKLFIKTGTDHTFEFTVGSDKALVDGVSEKLPEAFYVVDGLPALPLKFVYDKAGINYEETADGLSVKIRSGDIFDIITSRVPYEYEFNVDNDNEGWSLVASTGYTSDGCLVMTSFPASTGRYDPVMQNSKVAIDASLYTSAVIRMKPVFADNSSSDVSATIYFSTSNDTQLNEKKTLRAQLKDFTPDEEGFYTLTFDATKNELWKGFVMTVRFDPPNRAGDFYIDYIKFLKDPNIETKEEEEKQKQQIREQNLAIADNGGPFYIENADAEDLSFEPLHSSYRFSDDSIISENRAFEHVPNGTTKNWAYTIIPTRFKPGVTYKVEMDIRVTKDHLGNDVTDASIAWNLRYSDTIDGIYKPMVDHHNGLGKFSTSDGWQHVSFTHTISSGSITRDNDFFTMYADPQVASDGSYKVIGYMIDNIKVSVV